MVGPRAPRPYEAGALDGSHEALCHAVEAHAGQTDKCGNDYILHPLAVAKTIGEPYEVIAVLHDVLEDTSHELRASDFEDWQWSALLAITQREGETYFDYIARVCLNPIACYVKLADLWHNLSPARQACLPPGERKGLEKRYLKARGMIWAALEDEWWPEEITS